METPWQKFTCDFLKWLKINAILNPRKDMIFENLIWRKNLWECRLGENSNSILKQCSTSHSQTKYVSWTLKHQKWPKSRACLAHLESLPFLQYVVDYGCSVGLGPGRSITMSCGLAVGNATKILGFWFRFFPWIQKLLHQGISWPAGN